MSIHKPIKCEYNGHVDCETPIRCKTCGWNPSVDKERRERLMDGSLARKTIKTDSGVKLLKCLGVSR